MNRPQSFLLGILYTFGILVLGVPALAEEFAEVQPAGPMLMSPAALPPEGTKFNVLGRPSGEPNAAEIYNVRCAECHSRAMFSPNLMQLSNLTAEEAHKELTGRYDAVR